MLWILLTLKCHTSKFKDKHNGSLYPVYGRLLEVQYDIPAVTFY